MENITIGLITLAGTVITAGGTIVVALISNGNHREQKRSNGDTQNSLEEIKVELKKNTKATVASSRAFISQVYSEHKDKKEITEQTWRNVLDLYAAYKDTTVNGHVPNSWCDALVEEMKTWSKI